MLRLSKQTHKQPAPCGPKLIGYAEVWPISLSERWLARSAS
jgi:hypothetical protein